MKAPKCKKCGKPLRDPRSIAVGMGPVCRGERGGGMKASRRVSKKRVRRGRLPQPKGGRLWSRGEEETGRPQVGARCRVVRPYLASDKERYVGKVGTITEVLGRGYGGYWHVRVTFDDEAIPEKLRVTAFPMYCLEILEGEG